MMLNKQCFLSQLIVLLAPPDRKRPDRARSQVTSVGQTKLNQISVQPEPHKFTGRKRGR